MFRRWSIFYILFCILSNNIKLPFVFNYLKNMKNVFEMDFFNSLLTFRLVHGWGYTQKFWAGLAKRMPDFETAIDEHGYLGANTHIYMHENDLHDVNGTRKNSAALPEIIITHSLGTLLALQDLPDAARQGLKGLIVINGFTNFLPFTTPAILAQMKKGLVDKPEAQMRAFWKACGHVPEYKTQDLNIPSLLNGLDVLGTLDVRDCLDSLDCPILVLAGAQDRICDIAVMKEHWAGYDLHIHPQGSHVLPHDDPQWCWTHIEEWIKRHYA
jgi:pimeloyl-ACP methyl ester carboxylesterase